MTPIPTTEGASLQVKIFQCCSKQGSVQDRPGWSGSLEKEINDWLSDGGSTRKIIDIRFFATVDTSVVMILYEI